MAKESLTKLERRHGRVRARIHGTATRPRLSVFRSNRFVTAQLIDDVRGRTLCAAGERELPKAEACQTGRRPEDVGFGKVARAYALGQFLAERARAAKISQVAFDRGGYRYAGRVRALAEGARAGGLIF